jgi:hypothetical protein
MGGEMVQEGGDQALEVAILGLEEPAKEGQGEKDHPDPGFP